MPRAIATTQDIDLRGLLAFIRPRHHLLLATGRRDGRPQPSPVTGGADSLGRIVISTYPSRAKTANASRDPQTSGLVLSDGWDARTLLRSGKAPPRSPAHLLTRTAKHRALTNSARTPTPWPQGSRT